MSARFFRPRPFVAGDIRFVRPHQVITQRRHDVIHRREPIDRSFGQHLKADGFERRSNAGIQVRQSLRIVVGDLLGDRENRTFERQSTGEQFVQDHAETEDVTRSADGFRVAGDLLRRHIGWRAQQSAMLRDANVFHVEPCRQAEIHDDRLAIVVDHDVARLDVAMHDAVRMSLTQSPGNLEHQHGRFSRLEVLSVPQQVRKWLPVDVGHRDEVDSVHFIDVVNGTDAGVPQQRDRSRFAEEPLHQLVARSVHFEPGNFQRDIPVQLLIMSQIHGPHRSTPNDPFEPIAAELIRDGNIAKRLTRQTGFFVGSDLR